MDMQGLDVEQVQELARGFERKADEVDEVLRQLHLGLRETDWVGPDRQRFEGDFEGTITPDLRVLERVLRDTAERLRQEARSQEQASRW